MATQFTWPLLADPTPTGGGSGSSSAASSSSPIDGILGFGLTRPFQRDQKNDFASSGGVALAKSAVGQVLGTRAQGGKSQGELRWRQEFGSKLYLLRNRKGPAQDQLARAYVQEALQRWAPQVNVTAVATDFDRTTRALTIHVKFDVISQSKPGNNVLLKGLTTSVPIS